MLGRIQNAKGNNDRHDAQLVCETARRHGIAEYELCRRAWQSWFGQVPDDEVIKARFIAFMLQGDTPFWLRHYCKRQQTRRDPRPGDKPLINTLVA